MRVLNWIMFTIFLASAIVQYNDSDWIFWVFIYLLSAIFCLFKHIGVIPRFGYWTYALLVFLMAVYWVQTVPNEVDVLATLTDTGMVQLGSERVREFGGLVLVGTWMAVLGFQHCDQ